MRFAIMSLVAASVLVSVNAHAEAEWTKVHERNGVVVAVRPRIGSRLNELSAVGDVDAPPERVRAVLADMERYPDFMPPTSMVRLLQRNGNSFLYYMEINPPVVARRDYCLRVVWKELSGGGWHGTWEADNQNCLAERRGVVRMRQNEGEWILEPSAGGLRTHLRYRCHLDVAGHVPAWLFNRVSASAIPKVFAAVQRSVLDLRYSKAQQEPAAGDRAEPMDLSVPD